MSKEYTFRYSLSSSFIIRLFNYLPPCRTRIRFQSALFYPSGRALQIRPRRRFIIGEAVPCQTAARQHNVCRVIFFVVPAFFADRERERE